MATGDVTPQDVTISGSGGGGSIPPSGGGGLRNLSKTQKYAIAGVAAVVIGVGVYIIAKKKSAAAAATAATASTTPAANSSNGEVAETPQYDGQGNVDQGGGNNFSNTLTQLFAQQDQEIAAEIAALNSSSNLPTLPSGATSVNPGGPVQPANLLPTRYLTSAGIPVYTSTGISPTGLSTNPGQASRFEVGQSGIPTLIPGSGG